MKISSVFKTYREATMFKYLASLSHVDQMTVQICQFLLKNLTIQPGTTVQQLSRALSQQIPEVKLADAKRVVQDLLNRKVLIKRGSKIRFRIRWVKDPVASVPNQNSDAARSDDQSSSVSVIHSERSSKSSNQTSSETNSSGNQWVNQLDDKQSSDLDAQSPLGSYFASVNSDLNDDYLKNNGYSSSSHGDHLVNRNNLDWLGVSAASSSVEQAAKSSKQDNHLDFATTPTSSESSAVSSNSAKSARASSQSSSSNAQSSSSRALQGRSYHSKHSDGNRFRSIAGSLFKKVSFISLMSHPARVRKIAKAEFNLVVASRKYEGIKQADDLFKYEFKMNYQKFGKIGNRINNLLMKDISSHNN